MGDLTPFDHQEIKETLSSFIDINEQVQNLKSVLLLQKDHNKERDLKHHQGSPRGPWCGL